MYWTGVSHVQWQQINTGDRFCVHVLNWSTLACNCVFGCAMGQGPKYNHWTEVYNVNWQEINTRQRFSVHFLWWPLAIEIVFFVGCALLELDPGWLQRALTWSIAHQILKNSLHSITSISLLVGINSPIVQLQLCFWLCQERMYLEPVNHSMEI